MPKGQRIGYAQRWQQVEIDVGEDRNGHQDQDEDEALGAGFRGERTSTRGGAHEQVTCGGHVPGV
jgi:hypothetical protein